MKIENGKFYFISDDYFNLFKKQKLMANKEDGSKRPCYLCFKDSKNSSVIWFVPISHKVEKYKAIYNKKIKKYKKVRNFVFGSVLGEEKVFLIQNIMPVTKKYIIGKYKTKGQDVKINHTLMKEIIKNAKEIINLTEKYGNKIAFADILKMKEILLEEEKISV